MMLFQLNNLHSSEKEDSHKWWLRKDLEEVAMSYLRALSWNSLGV
jgi:hypothetical protein